MNKLKDLTVKEKMATIINKWKDKPESEDSTTQHCRRVVDRMLYREYKRQLEKCPKWKNIQYNEAKAIFK